MKRNVITNLQAALNATQEELKSYPQEETTQEIPKGFRTQVWYYLNNAIQKGKEEAKEAKAKDPSTHKHICHSSFSEELYKKLLQKHNSGFMKELKALGFEFYMTHNLGPDDHPMVKFTLSF